MVVHSKPHPMAGFIDTIINGKLTALNTPESGFEDVKCVRCWGGEDQARCNACAGRGQIDNVPYPENPWDEVVEGLCVGGHQCQPVNGVKGTMGEVWVRDEFDLVVSLAIHHESKEAPRFGPTSGDHVLFIIKDSDLDPDHHSRIEDLSMMVATRVKAGDRVLVRCWGGINRSALVAALAMVKLGYPPAEAIDILRTKRSPFCLFNQSFEAYVRAAETGA